MRALISLLLLTSPAFATTYFGAVPYIFIQGNPGDTCVSNPAACAKSSDVNADFNKLVTDGNAAKAAILSQLSGITTAGMPSGAVIMINNPLSCPFGYVIADGSTGTPDLRGVFVRGLDKGAGRDPGRVLNTFQGDALEDHVHGATAAAGGSSGATAPSGGFSVISFLNTTGVTVENQDGGLNETRPDSVILLHCIKP